MRDYNENFCKLLMIEMTAFLVLFVLLVFLNNSCGIIHPGLDEDDEIGEPLLLTPLLESGRIGEAKSAARVSPLLGKEKSYSGFFTVDATHKSNMFFWYFPVENDFPNAPVVLWLQGGPGLSSLLGLFIEHGPYFLENGELKMRSLHWSQAFHVIYVDNPVGAGFSFTYEEGICKDQDCIGKNLYRFVTQFFNMFSELKVNEFYIAGQSYACKYIAALGHQIHTNNLSEKDKINFKGIAVGNGLCDPVNMLDHGTHLYQLGLIDDDGKRHFDEVKNEISVYIKSEKWGLAFDSAYELMTLEPFSASYFRNVTGFATCFNALKSDPYTCDGEWKQFIRDNTIKRSIHVGSLDLQHYSRVFTALKEDFMQSVSPWISEMANNYKVLIYSGQLDIMLPYTGTLRFIKNLEWNGSRAYHLAKRKIWMDHNGDVAGYIKRASCRSSGSLTEVLVRNAGHLVPFDQPAWALEMMMGFIFDLYPFKNNLTSIT